jgi:hypothetical protein
MRTGIPVKIEHRGTDVGMVVSAWMHEVSFFPCSAFHSFLQFV